MTPRQICAMLRRGTSLEMISEMQPGLKRGPGCDEHSRNFHQILTYTFRTEGIRAEDSYLKERPKERNGTCPAPSRAVIDCDLILIVLALNTRHGE